MATGAAMANNKAYSRDPVDGPSNQQFNLPIVTQWKINMNARAIIIFVLFTALLAAGCAVQEKSGDNSLVGAWRGKVQFKNGAFAAVKDLEFMYVFNEGGTMTESSNYDGTPPVPPAYGVWRKIGPNQFEARYEFFMTKSPASSDEITKGGGWLPAGHGVFVEKIVLSEDSDSFKSDMSYKPFDKTGKPLEGNGEAAVDARRMGF